MSLLISLIEPSDGGGGGGTYTAGSGLELQGNEFSIAEIPLVEGQYGATNKIVGIEVNNLGQIIGVSEIADIEAATADVSATTDAVAVSNLSSGTGNIYPALLSATSGNQQIKSFSSKISFNMTSGILNVSGVSGFSGETLSVVVPTAASTDNINYFVNYPNLTDFSQPMIIAFWNLHANNTDTPLLHVNANSPITLTREGNNSLFITDLSVNQAYFVYYYLATNTAVVLNPSVASGIYVAADDSTNDDKPLLHSITTGQPSLVHGTLGITANPSLSSLNAKIFAGSKESGAKKAALVQSNQIQKRIDNTTLSPYTIINDDSGKLLVVERDNDVSLVLHGDLEEQFQVQILQIGAGAATVTPHGDDFLENRWGGVVKTNGAYSPIITITKILDNTVDLFVATGNEPATP